MDPQKLIEEILQILTNIELSFYWQDIAPKPSAEQAHPEPHIIWDISLKHPEIAEQWRRYLNREELAFSSFWQCALGFSRFWRAYDDEQHSPPAGLRGL